MYIGTFNAQRYDFFLNYANILLELYIFFSNKSFSRISILFTILLLSYYYPCLSYPFLLLYISGTFVIARLFNEVSANCR